MPSAVQLMVARYNKLRKKMGIGPVSGPEVRAFMLYFRMLTREAIDEAHRATARVNALQAKIADLELQINPMQPVIRDREPDEPRH